MKIPGVDYNKPVQSLGRQDASEPVREFAATSKLVQGVVGMADDYYRKESKDQATRASSEFSAEATAIANKARLDPSGYGKAQSEQDLKDLIASFQNRDGLTPMAQETVNTYSASKGAEVEGVLGATYDEYDMKVAQRETTEAFNTDAAIPFEASMYKAFATGSKEGIANASEQYTQVIEDYISNNNLEGYKADAVRANGSKRLVKLSETLERMRVNTQVKNINTVNANQIERTLNQSLVDIDDNTQGTGLDAIQSRASQKQDAVTAMLEVVTNGAVAPDELTANDPEYQEVLAAAREQYGDTTLPEGEASSLGAKLRTSIEKAGSKEFDAWEKDLTAKAATIGEVDLQDFIANGNEAAAWEAYNRLLEIGTLTDAQKVSYEMQIEQANDTFKVTQLIDSELTVEKIDQLEDAQYVLTAGNYNGKQNDEWRKKQKGRVDAELKRIRSATDSDTAAANAAITNEVRRETEDLKTIYRWGTGTDWQQNDARLEKLIAKAESFGVSRTVVDNLRFQKTIVEYVGPRLAGTPADMEAYLDEIKGEVKATELQGMREFYEGFRKALLNPATAISARNAAMGMENITFDWDNPLSVTRGVAAAISQSERAVAQMGLPRSELNRLLSPDQMDTFLATLNALGDDGKVALLDAVNDGMGDAPPSTVTRFWTQLGAESGSGGMAWKRIAENGVASPTAETPEQAAVRKKHIGVMLTGLDVIQSQLEKSGYDTLPDIATLNMEQLNDLGYLGKVVRIKNRAGMLFSKMFAGTGQHTEQTAAQDAFVAAYVGSLYNTEGAAINKSAVENIIEDASDPRVQYAMNAAIGYHIDQGSYRNTKLDVPLPVDSDKVAGGMSGFRESIGAMSARKFSSAVDVRNEGVFGDRLTSEDIQNIVAGNDPHHPVSYRQVGKTPGGYNLYTVELIPTHQFLGFGMRLRSGIAHDFVPTYLRNDDGTKFSFSFDPAWGGD